jgi:hypothetical protein
MKTVKYIAVLLIIMVPIAKAGVIRVSESNFNSGAGLITFSEFATGTVNPTYSPATYGGDATDPTVTFDGFFTGQSISNNPGVDCPGAAATACVVGSPSGGILALDASSPDTFITTDGANPTSPVLSGTPQFNGAIAVLFSTDQLGVGFDAGFFNANASTAITAFARDGSLLGSVSNISTGVEFLGLITDDGSESIAGVFLDLVGDEPAGFAIDNIRFGVVGDVNPVPVPAAIWMFGSGILGLIGMRKRSSKRFV